MKKIVEKLLDDHIIVRASLERIGSLLNDEIGSHLNALENELIEFERFTLKEHHAREDKLLFTWIKKHNPDSSIDIIDRVVNEHTELEVLVTSFRERIRNYDQKDRNILVSDIADFLRSYNQHIEREENVIFIAAAAMTT